MSANNQIDVHSPAAQAYIEELKADQVALAKAAERSLPGTKMGQYIDENGVTQDLGYQIAFNGLTLSVPDDSPRTMRELMRLPGVKMVYPVQEYKLNMDASLPLIGLGDPEVPGDETTNGLWDRLPGGPENAGAGLKVAVLDTGIDIYHDFFDPTGFAYPTGYPKGNAAYTTEKVIVSRAYYRADDPPVFDDPLDHNGHGSHTSGTIAGNYGVTATVGTYDQVVSGIAPGAHLMNYQIFYQAVSGAESAWNAEILRALDDLILDGADVTNNSWGGPDNLLAHADPIAQAFQNIIDHNIVAVKSAGNAGRGQGSADPAGPDDILLVGATTTSRNFGNSLDVTAPTTHTIPPTVTNILATEAAFTPEITQTFGPETYVYVGRPEPSNYEGCNAFGTTAAAEITGNIALISRGSCDFVDKVENAYDAGAVGVVVFNNVKGAPPIIMGGDPTAKTVIPAFMVGNEPGENLVDWETMYPGEAALQIGADTTKIPDAKPADIIADFSASGPDIALNVKPDIVAPGVDILSSVADNEWSTYQGTSMAAPHVAGAAVLLRQLYPSWSVHEIKSALMTTAKVDGLYNDYSQTDPAGAMDRGAGRIDLVAAGDPGIVVDMPSLSFGEMEPGETMTYTVTATNVAATGTDHTYTTAISETGNMTTTANFDLTVTPASVAIDDAGDDTIDVVMEIPADADPGDYDGLVWLRHGPHEAHIPVWVRVVPEQTTTNVLVIDDDFSLFGFPDYVSTYTDALDTLGVTYHVWNTDMKWLNATGDTGGLPDVATLQNYDTILWFTGDNYYPYFNFGAMIDDRWAMLDFLRSSGGKLAVFGQDFSGYQLNGDPDIPYLPAIGLSADVTPNTEDIYDFTAGAAGPEVRGMLNSPFASVYLDFTGSTQAYVDELLAQGVNDQGLDYGGKAVMEALVPGATAAGAVGVVRHVEPTLENMGVYDSPDYRTAYMSFGLEGINEAGSTVTQAELVEMLYEWLMDEVSAEIRDNIGGPLNTVIPIEAEATSSVGAEFTQFRWDFGDGTPRGTTSDGTVYHLYTAPGTYTVTVEATDGYGHKALATGQVVINEGIDGTTDDNVPAGAMTMPNDSITQTIVMQGTVMTPTTGLMVNPLPEHTEYITHTGGTWVGATTGMALSADVTTPGGNTLTITNSVYISDTLSAGEATTVTLTYRIMPGTSADKDIVNISKFWVGDDDNYFERRTTIDVWGQTYMPIIFK
jgi:subtilisin family serine protease